MGVACSLKLRPSVPMGHVTGVPFVCALAVARELGGRVSWPYGVVDAQGAPLATVRSHAGYDGDGVFVACEITVSDEGGAAGIEGAARDAVDAWAADVAAGRAAAGPLAPVLEGYFDALAGMGERMEVVRGGRVIARGTLAGVDVWGRATVRLDGGEQELEIAPEQALLRPAE